VFFLLQLTLTTSLMALTKVQKTEQLAELKDKMSTAQSVIFAHYIGMTVGDSSDFRRKLKEGKAEMKVAKKTLMRIAAKELNLPEVAEDQLDGPVACIFSFEDPLSGAQIAFKFSKDHPQVALIGGLFEGKVLSKEDAVRLAKIPSKKQLLGMFAAMCNSPLSSFARGLSEIAKQKEAPKVEEAPKAEAAPAAEAKTEETPAPAAAEATPSATEEVAAAPAVDAPPAA
jgi:large subunit ribosomal protein L10